MLKLLAKINQFFLNLLFPQNCLNCQKEGDYLCADCFSLIEIVKWQYCPFCQPPKIVFDGKTCLGCKRKGRKLDGLFFVVPYQNFIIKKLISQFKYEPFVKEICKTLSTLIVHYFYLLEYKPDFLIEKNKKDFFLIPVPLAKKRLKWRGFNQAEEIAKELSVYFKIPLLFDALIKTKETFSQTELSAEEREKNIKGVFVCKKSEIIKSKKIILVDDVFTTGSTMEECARILKEAGAKEVWGIVVARE